MSFLPSNAAASRDPAHWIEAVYRVRQSAANIEGRAQALALEQSIEAPLDAVRDARVLAEVVAQVAGIARVEDDLFDVTIHIAAETTGYEAGQLLNMLFGNSSLQDDVALVDASFPETFARAFGGPRLGIQGIRALT